MRAENPTCREIERDLVKIALAEKQPTSTCCDKGDRNFCGPRNSLRHAEPAEETLRQNQQTPIHAPEDVVP